MPCQEDIVYSSATEDEREEVVEFILDNFVHRETLAQSLHQSRNEAWKTFWSALTAEDFKQPLSIVARDGSQSLVGCRITGVVAMETAEKMFDHMDLEMFPDENIRKVAGTVKFCCSGLGLRELYPAAQKVAVFHNLCVKEGYEGLGIAKRMNLIMLEKAKQMGCDGVYASASGKAAAAVFESLGGFEILREVFYKDYVDANGEAIIKPLNGSKSYKVYYKVL